MNAPPSVAPHPPTCHYLRRIGSIRFLNSPIIPASRPFFQTIILSDRSLIIWRTTDRNDHGHCEEETRTIRCVVGKEGVGDVDESSRYETGPAVPCNFSGKIVICSLRRARLIVSREPKESTSVFLHLFSRRRRMKNTDVRKRTRPMSTGLSLSPLFLSLSSSRLRGVNKNRAGTTKKIRSMIRLCRHRGCILFRMYRCGTNC